MDTNCGFNPHYGNMWGFCCFLFNYGCFCPPFVRHHFNWDFIKMGTDVMVFGVELVKISKHAPPESLKLADVFTWAVHTLK